MASAIYPTYKNIAMRGNTSANLVTSGNVFAALINNSYTYDGGHDRWTNANTFIVGSAVALTTTDVHANGTFTADTTTTFTSVSGSQVAAVIIYRFATDNASSPLVAYLDANNITGLPVTPNGGDITITWSGTGIFTL